MSFEQDAVALIFKRNQYYRRQYLLTFGVFLLSVFVILTLFGVINFIKRNQTKPLYFATDPIGRLIPVVPVSQPNMKMEEVVAWVEEAVQKIYSYDYINYREQFQEAEKYFTPYGWTNYLKALIASNNIVALSERKMIVIAEVVGMPKTLAKGLLGGAYAYKFEMPMLLTYWVPPYDEKSKFSNPLTVTLIVQRQPILQSYQGLGIIQLIGMIAGGGQPAQLSTTP